MNNRKYLFPLIILLMGLTLSFAGEAYSADDTVLTGINISNYSVRVEASGKFPYTLYRPSPYTVVIELTGVKVGSIPAKIVSDKPGISEVRVTQIEMPESVKVEVLLDSPVEIEAIPDTGVLTLVLSESAGAEATSEETPESGSEKPAYETSMEETPTMSPATVINNVSIDRTDKDLRVLIKGDGFMAPKVFTLGNRVVLDVPDVKMKAALPEGVTPPVKAVRYGEHEDKVRIVIDLTKESDFRAEQKGDTISVLFQLETIKVTKQVGEAAEEAAEPLYEEETDEEEGATSGHKYIGKKINFDFQNADIVPIFRLMGDIAGYSVVIHPDVKGNITLKLVNVPWDQAMAIILQTFNLEYEVEGNIMTVASSAVFSQWRESAQRQKEAKKKLADLEQEVIRINYADAKDIMKAISDSKIMTTRENITPDTRMNTLILNATADSIRKIKDLVRIMDVAKQQVMIEARIVEVSSNYAKSLGIKWGGTGVASNWPPVSGDFSVNTPVSGAGPDAEGSGGVVGMTIGSVNSLQVSLSLEALETVGKSKRLSNPRVLTMDNESATIMQGVSIPVSTTTAEGTKTEFVNANLNLSVTPKITPEGYVQIKVMAANDSLGILTPQGYSIERKNVTTQALVKNGETLVLGGIYKNDTLEGETRVPFLGKIPLLGWLFKTKNVTGPSPTELMIFITPTIVQKSS